MSVPDTGEISEEEYLARYDPRAFPPQSVTVDLALFTIRDDVLDVLLVERGGHPYKGCWALPGGFVDENEDLDSTARRELAEETRIDTTGVRLEQIGTYGSPERDPRTRVFSVVHMGLVSDPGDATAGDDARNAKWWPLGKGPERFAFDHALILNDAAERLRRKLEYTTIAARSFAKPFTIGELRRLYEAIWRVELHETNFRRKVLASKGFVIPTGDTIRIGRGKPVALYAAGTGEVLHPPISRPPV